MAASDGQSGTQWPETIFPPERCVSGKNNLKIGSVNVWYFRKIYGGNWLPFFPKENCVNS